MVGIQNPVVVRDLSSLSRGLGLEPAAISGLIVPAFEFLTHIPGIPPIAQHARSIFQDWVSKSDSGLSMSVQFSNAVSCAIGDLPQDNPKKQKAIDALARYGKLLKESLASMGDLNILEAGKLSIFRISQTHEICVVDQAYRDQRRMRYFISDNWNSTQKALEAIACGSYIDQKGSLILLYGSGKPGSGLDHEVKISGSFQNGRIVAGPLHFEITEPSDGCGPLKSALENVGREDLKGSKVKYKFSLQVSDRQVEQGYLNDVVVAIDLLESKIGQPSPVSIWSIRGGKVSLILETSDPFKFGPELGPCRLPVLRFPDRGSVIIRTG